eukprot:scaffold15751_cov20-Prasinocladus_malaysianus.AAC.1
MSRMHNIESFHASYKTMYTTIVGGYHKTCYASLVCHCVDTVIRLACRSHVWHQCSSVEAERFLASHRPVGCAQPRAVSDGHLPGGRPQARADAGRARQVWPWRAAPPYAHLQAQRGPEALLIGQEKG